MTHIILAIIFSVLILPGLVLVFIPMMPSLSYMLFIAVVYGLLEGFSRITLSVLLVFLGIVLLGVLNDYLTGALGARLAGASAKSLLYGLIGLLVGFIMLPPFGGLVGIFAGVLVSELFLHGNGRRAFKAATGSLIGAAAGIIINEILALIFLGLFLFFIFL